MKLRILSALFLTALQGCASISDSLPQVTGNRIPESQGSIILTKTKFQPGEQIDVKVEGTGLHASSWVGILPPEIEHGREAVNDQHDLDSAGITQIPLYLVAPDQPGHYEIRLNDFDEAGKEVAFTPIEVTNDVVKETKIELTKTVFFPEEPLEFRFSATAKVRIDGWIGIIPSGIPHGDELLNDRHDHGTIYLKGRRKGTDQLKAPKFLGKYDLRMHEGDSGGRELTHITFEVIAPPTPEPAPTF